MFYKCCLKNAGKPIRIQQTLQGISTGVVLMIFLFVFEKGSGNFSPLF